MKIVIQDYRKSATSIASIADGMMDIIRENVDYNGDTKYDIVIAVDLMQSNDS